jgi:DNA-binding transcriptional LysR family regulator
VDDDLRWDDLKVLLAAFRSGTLLGAAQALETHASTIGRRLAALEAALGGHLFDRASDGLHATDLAEALVPLAEAMEARIADVRRVIEGRETEPEGWVRVTAPPGIATFFVAPALPRLYARYPGLRVELLPSVAYADLTRHEADLALRAGLPSSGDLLSTRVAEITMRPLASPSVVEDLGALRRLDDAWWLQWSDTLAHLPDARWIASNVSADRIALRCSTFEPLVLAARAGVGVMMGGAGTFGPEPLEPVRLAPALAKRLPPFPQGSLYLVGHRALRDVPRIAAVWDFIVDAARDQGKRRLRY